ncbi:MAG: 4Fe-4S binding protein [Spirochaetaceae bacterium]
MRTRRLRRVLQGVSLAAFPVTIYYFSPAIPILGFSHGVASGSLLVFGALFVTSILFGRSFCSYLCPMGAWQDILARVRGNPVRRRWPVYLRWILWTLWLGAIAATYVGYRLRNPDAPIQVDPLLGTANGVSVHDAHGVVVLVSVFAAFSGAALLLGRRGACKSVCWMAPFMILGTEVGHRLGLPQRRLLSAPGSCPDCRVCAGRCPMSLNPEAVAKGVLRQSRECILCGECLPACPRSQLRIAGPLLRRAGATGTGADAAPARVDR